MLRKMLGRIRKFIIIFEAKLNYLKWACNPNKNASGVAHSGHLLLVKKSIYAEISKICIVSFLYWNKKAKVIVHCDEVTYKLMISWKKPKKLEPRIEINSTYDFDSRSWQELKLDLLLSLNGTDDFFMDADLRWNGPLNFKPSRPTFLVREFKLQNRSPYRQLIHSQIFKDYLNAHMWNTSFFTFAGLEISSNQIQEILEIHEKLLQVIQSSLFGDEDKPGLFRIAEQLALSMAVENWNTEVDQIKYVDGFKDGTFLESSYFGATGATF